MNFGDFDVTWLLVNILVLLFSLSIHESSHAWAADRFGDSTGRRLGRVTLNPIPHIDPVGTLLFPLIGLIAGGVIFGWAKPVPVNTANLKDPRFAGAAIAAAGPLSNIAAAVFFLIGFKLLAVFGTPAASDFSLVSPLLMLCQVGLVLNVILAVFNLIPIPPLDGSWILGGLLPMPFSNLIDALRPYGFLLLLLLLYTGVFGMFLRPVLRAVRQIAF